MGAEASPLASCIVKLHEPVLVPPAKPCEHNSPYFLSNLDQNLAVIMHTVYFYKGLEVDPENAAEDPAPAIRKALEQVLVSYYPLAGRLSLSPEMKLEVVCNDAGALFVEAEAGVTLNEFVAGFTSELGKGSVSSTLAQFVYNVPDSKSILDLPPVVAQVTKFKCGGFVLGLATNHALFDGQGAMEFINTWADTARGVPLSDPPVLDRSMLKARTPLQIEFEHPEFLDANSAESAPSAVPATPTAPPPPLVFRKMTFDSDKLESLKRNIISQGLFDKCSGFEAFAALVWKCRTVAMEKSLQSDKGKQTKLLFAVDVRNRLEPPLPKGYFGNGIILTGALTSVGELMESSLSETIELIRKAISRVNDSYLRSLIDFYEKTRLRPSLESTLVITTWSRLAFHTTDFGWGTPLFTAPASLPEPEVALFLPHGESRTGFELVLGLPPHTMEEFESLLETSWKM